MEPARVAALRATKALYDDGVLDQQEYEAKKRELLHAPAQQSPDGGGSRSQDHRRWPRKSARWAAMSFSCFLRSFLIAARRAADPRARAPSSDRMR